MATFDAITNFGYMVVATAPVPAVSGTSLVVSAGGGALLPAAPFNCTVWPTGVGPLKTNAEIVRVTAVVGDTLTIVRAQETSTARIILVGDQFALTITRKAIVDIQDAINALPPSAGDVVGPASSVDGRPALFDGATGKLLKEAAASLGTAAFQATGAFDAAGAAAAAQAASQPLDSDLTAIAALTTTAFGRALLEKANAAALATAAGLGTGDSPVFAAVTANGVALINRSGASDFSNVLSVQRAGTNLFTVRDDGLIQPVNGILASGGNFWIQPGVGFFQSSGALLRWTAGASVFDTEDTAIGRNAAGVVEVNNGTPGAFSDLKLRNLIATGTGLFSGILQLNNLLSFSNAVYVCNSASNVLEINDGTPGSFADLKLRNLIPSGGNCCTEVTVGTLPTTAATGRINGSAFVVTDAFAYTPGATVANGGSAYATVRWNGSNWIMQ